MQTTGMFYSMILPLGIMFYFAGIIVLSKRRQIYLGLSLPCISLLVSIFYFIKPSIIENPYPTMMEGIYSIFFGGLSILGFIVFAIIKISNRYIK